MRLNFSRLGLSLILIAILSVSINLVSAQHAWEGGQFADDIQEAYDLILNCLRETDGTGDCYWAAAPVDQRLKALWDEHFEECFQQHGDYTGICKDLDEATSYFERSPTIQSFAYDDFKKEQGTKPVEIGEPEEVEEADVRKPLTREELLAEAYNQLALQDNRAQNLRQRLSSKALTEVTASPNPAKLDEIFANAKQLAPELTRERFNEIWTNREARLKDGPAGTPSKVNFQGDLPLKDITVVPGVPISNKYLEGAVFDPSALKDELSGAGEALGIPDYSLLESQGLPKNAFSLKIVPPPGVRAAEVKDAEGFFSFTDKPLEITGFGLTGYAVDNSENTKLFRYDETSNTWVSVPTQLVSCESSECEFVAYTDKVTGYFAVVSGEKGASALIWVLLVAVLAAGAGYYFFFMKKKK